MPGRNIDISRVLRLKKEAKIFYDRIGKWYDLTVSRFERKYVYSGVRKLCVNKKDIVLEIGFGTGDCIVIFARLAGSLGRVYGIDLSGRMCEIARLKIKKEGFQKRVKLLCGDAAELPFHKNFFDKIFMSFTLELFDTPEIPILLYECRRVLKIGGHICVVSLSKKRKVSVAIYEWFHKRFPRYFDCRPIFVREALKNSGFYIIEVTETSMWGLPVEIALAEKVAKPV